MKKIFLIIYLTAVAILITAYYSNAQDWKPNPKYIKSNQPGARDTANKFQCYGTTQKGDRCKRHVNTDHSFCYQHNTQK